MADVAMNGHANGDVDAIIADAVGQAGAPRFSSGLILPPPEIKCASAQFLQNGMY